MVYQLQQISCSRSRIILPELPEVQTVVNSLQNIKFKSFRSFKSSWHKVSYNHSTNFVKSHIRQSQVYSINRLGKYIIIKTNKWHIAFHLRMTGYLYYSKTKLPKNKKYVRCYFKFTDNSYLIFEDIRKFGGFYYTNSLDKIRSKLGLDPFNLKFTSS